MYPPVFIHSLFRTGSSYLFSKFRERTGEFYCYYEPFHHYLGRITVEGIQSENQYQKVLRHSSITMPYFLEYKKMLNEPRGVKNFQVDFILKDYFQVGEGDKLSAYIEGLLQNAIPKIPLLQFNRSAMRTEWFKQNYPDSLNVYILRNPRDQWQSYENLLRKNKPYFSAMDFLILSVAGDEDRFGIGSTLAPLFRFPDISFERLIVTGNQIVKYLSREERYAIFYYIWKMAFEYNEKHADLIIDVKDLSRESGIQLNEFLGLKYSLSLQFDDCVLPVYENYDLSSDDFKRIERIVVRLMSEGREGNGSDLVIRQGELLSDLAIDYHRSQHKMQDRSIRQIIKSRILRFWRGC